PPPPRPRVPPLHHHIIRLRHRMAGWDAACPPRGQGALVGVAEQAREPVQVNPVLCHAGSMTRARHPPPVDLEIGGPPQPTPPTPPRATGGVRSAPAFRPGVKRTVPRSGAGKADS